MLDTNPLLDIWLTNVFSLFWLFFLLSSWCHLKPKHFLILIKFNLSFFFLSSRAFGVIAKKSLLNSGPIYWIFFSLEYFYSISRWPWNRCNLLENRLVIAPGSDSESQICRSGRPRLCVCIWRWRWGWWLFVLWMLERYLQNSVNLVKTGLTVDSNEVKIGFVLLK